MLLYFEKSIEGKTEHDFRYVVAAPGESGATRIVSISECLFGTGRGLDISRLKNVYVAPIPITGSPVFSPIGDIPQESWMPIGAVLPPVDTDVLGVYWGEGITSESALMLFYVRRDEAGNWSTWNTEMTDRVGMLELSATPAPSLYIKPFGSDFPTSRTWRAIEKLRAFADAESERMKALH